MASWYFEFVSILLLRIMITGGTDSPDYDQNLIFDVAFDKDTGLQDRVCGLQPFVEDRPEMIKSSQKHTTSNFAYSVAMDQSSIGGYRYLPLESGITICFYFYQFYNKSINDAGKYKPGYLAVQPSGILQVNFGDNSTYLSLWADNTNSIFNIIHFTLSTNGTVIDSGEIGSSWNDWGYQCIAYNRLRKHVTVYHNGPGKYFGANRAERLEKPFEPDYLGVEILIGQAVTSNGERVYLNQGDAIACLTVYDAVMDAAIDEVFYSYTPIRNCTVPPRNNIISTTCDQRKDAPSKIDRYPATSSNSQNPNHSGSTEWKSNDGLQGSSLMTSTPNSSRQLAGLLGPTLLALTMTSLML